MNIARRNTGENWVGIVQPGSNNSTGNGLRSFRINIRANVAKSTDVKVGRRANVGNVTIKIEMIVKSLMWFARGTDKPATAMEVRLLSDLSRGLVPKQIASVLVGLRTLPLWRNQLWREATHRWILQRLHTRKRWGEMKRECKHVLFTKLV